MSTTGIDVPDGQGARLKWLRANGPLAQFKTVRGMCEHLGIGKSTWYDWVNDIYPPDGHILEWLADRGISLEWLKTGVGAPLVDDMGSHTSEPKQGLTGRLVEHQEARRGHDIPYVRWVDGSVSAIEPTGEFFAFTDDELQAIRVDTTAMDGPSPDALRFGDTVLIRLGGIPESNETWAVRYRAENAGWSDVDIRRVVLLDTGCVLLSPNNPLFDEIEKSGQEIDFLGKVEYRIAELHLGERETPNANWIQVGDPESLQLLKKLSKLDDNGRRAVFGMIESLLKR